MSKQWIPSQLPGSYISADGRITAELRKAGRYDGIPMVRHYAIRYRNGNTILGMARTLKEAFEMYV